MTHRTPVAPYLSVLFDQFPTAVLVADDDAWYVAANQAACTLLGRTHDELVGHHLSDLVAPGRMEEVNVQWRAFIRDGVQSGLFAIGLPDGTSRLVRFNARANFAPGLHCSFLTAESATTNETPRGTVTLCAWTKNVLYRDAWVTIEEYLLAAHGILVTHGVSPDALRDQGLQT